MNSRKINYNPTHHHFGSCNLINDTLFISYDPVYAQPFNHPPTRRLLAKDPPLFRILFLSLLKNKMKVYKRSIVHRYRVYLWPQLQSFIFQYLRFKLTFISLTTKKTIFIKYLLEKYTIRHKISRLKHKTVNLIILKGFDSDSRY